MRRYHRLVILVICLLSILAFLVYKHEYERLRNILQVLNTFGDPARSSLAIGFDDSDDLKETTLSSGPWRQLDADIHVVSLAFLVGQSIVVHGIVRRGSRKNDYDPTNELSWTHCNIWQQPNKTEVFNATDADKLSKPLEFVRPVKVKIHQSVEDFDSNNSNVWAAFTLTCDDLQPVTSAMDITRNEPPPIVVSFSSRKSASANLDFDASVTMTPMISVHVPHPRKKFTKSKDVAICGFGSSTNSDTPLDESIVVQFIEYHHYIGINNFIVYVDGLFPSVRQRLLRASSKYKDLSIEIINWNSPMSFGSDKRSLKSASSIIMKLDCMARLKKMDNSYENKYATFLEINELVVPRHHSRLANFVNEESDANVDGAMLGGLSLGRRIFCTNFEDGPNGISASELFVIRYKFDLVILPPMFTKTRWFMADNYSINELNETSLLEISALKIFSQKGSPILKSGYKLLKVSQDLANIHTYMRCGKHVEQLPGQANYDDIVVNTIRDEFLWN